jgi:hypothetical protein
MPVNVGTLVIDLVAGTSSFTAAMDKMSALSAKTANDISRSLMKISVAGVAAVTAVAGGLVAMAKSTLESVAALDRAAQSAGTTTETLSLLQYAAQTSGVETEALTNSLVKLAKAELAAETGNTKLAAVFQKLGVNVSDGNKHLRDSGAVYEELAVKFAGMQDGAVKTALALQLFGKSGASQIPLLNKLGTEMAATRDEAQRLGLIVGQNTAQAAHQAEEEMKKLELTFRAVKLQIVSQTLPAINELLTKLFEIAKNADIPQLMQTFGEEARGAIVKVGEALAFAAKHATALKVALEALAAIQLSRVLLPLISDLAIGGWAKVGEGVGRFATSLLGLNRVIPVLTKFSAWLVDSIKFVGLLATEEGVASAATYVLEGALALIGGWVGLAVAAVAALGVGLYLLRDHFFTLGDATYKVRDIWNAAWIVMGNAFKWVSDKFSQFIGYMKGLWEGFVKWVSSITFLTVMQKMFTDALAWVGRMLGKLTPQFAIDALNQAKREREAAEAAAKQGPATPTGRTPTGTEPTFTGLEKPEKDPYREVIDKLKLAIDTQNAYIGVLGATPDAIAAVTAAEKAEAVILELNTRLKEKGKSLDADQKTEIRRLVALEESRKAVEDFGKSIETQRQQQALAADAADALAAAQLRGVDATREAQVENAINAEKLGKTTEQLREMGPYLDALRARLLDTMNRKAVDDLSTAIDQQEEKLAIEARQAAIMAEAWGRGEAAVAAARIQVELLGMELGKGAAEVALLRAHADDLSKALKAVADAQQATQAAQDLKALQDQAAEERILTAAIFGTVDAQRAAEIQAKTVAIDRAIAASTDAKVIEALRAERAQIIANTQAEQDRKDAQDALALRSPAEVYQRATEALEKQVEALAKANGGIITYGQMLGIAAKQQELLNQALDDEINKLLKVGGLTDGVKAFFLEMQKSAVSAARIMYDALNSTIDKLSDNLANLMTGQKANWAAMFKDIGHQMAQQSMKAMMQKALGALGAKLGINLQKMDGQSSDTALWVRMAGAGGPAIPGGKDSILGGMIPSLPGTEGDGDGGGFLSGDYAVPSGGAMGGFGKFLQSFSKLFGSFGGGEAGGGEVEPGSAYLVGERGPELRTFGASGNIHPADETRSLLTSGGGAVHYYNIDARGTDPALTEQRTRAAIIAAHQSAITTSTQVQSEKSARTPPMPRR